MFMVLDWDTRISSIRHINYSSFSMLLRNYFGAWCEKKNGDGVLMNSRKLRISLAYVSNIGLLIKHNASWLSFFPLQKIY